VVEFVGDAIEGVGGGGVGDLASSVAGDEVAGGAGDEVAGSAGGGNGNPIGEDSAAPDAAMDPRPKGRRPAGGLDPRPKGRRPVAEPDLPPTGKRPAALLDPQPMEEEARVLPTLPFRPAATLNAAAVPESDGVLGWSISLVKFPGKIEEYMETAVDLARKIHSRARARTGSSARRLPRTTRL